MGIDFFHALQGTVLRRRFKRDMGNQRNPVDMGNPRLQSMRSRLHGAYLSNVGASQISGPVQTIELSRCCFYEFNWFNLSTHTKWYVLLGAWLVICIRN